MIYSQVHLTVTAEVGIPMLVASILEASFDSCGIVVGHSLHVARSVCMKLACHDGWMTDVHCMLVLIGHIVNDRLDRRMFV